MGSLINRRGAGMSITCHKAYLSERRILRHILLDAHVPSGPLERCQGDHRGWIDPLLKVG